MLKKRHLIYLLVLLIQPDVMGQGVTPADWGLKAFHLIQEWLSGAISPK